MSALAETETMVATAAMASQVGREAMDCLRSAPPLASRRSILPVRRSFLYLPNPAREARAVRGAQAAWAKMAVGAVMAVIQAVKEPMAVEGGGEAKAVMAAQVELEVTVPLACRLPSIFPARPVNLW
ncbi:hypothetical protein WS68_16485 [Burkholderia sp. TSV86]|nr:hypothetical protein WS68_16485 [Burkholderia sp. TSV86]